jgi:flavin-dependent dehydrogenase
VTLRSYRPAALMIRRIEFDDLLIRLAVEAGAELVEGVEVTEATESRDVVEVGARDGRTFRGRLLVAADGVHSAVARRLGLNPGWPARDVALDMMEETPVASLRPADPDTLWVAYGYGGGEGYAYVFPKAAHVNVGIGYVLDYYRTEVGGAPYGIQRRFVGALRRREALQGDSSRAHFTPYLIPVGGPLRRTARGRVLLAGDAGGFVNGFTAEGIYYAMVSGELAGEAVAASLRPGGAPAAGMYERAWRREIGPELRDSVIVQRFLFGDPRRIDDMIAGARRWPALADRIVGYGMGDVPYAAARRSLLARFPLLAAKLWWMRTGGASGRTGFTFAGPAGSNEAR